MKIALIGTRGVPANYGGFETCAEELAVGLAERGHDVTVTCRPGNAKGDPASHRGAKLVYRPFIDTKSLGTITHTLTSLLYAARGDFDVLMVFNAGNAPLCILPRILRRRVAINVDGLEWKRAKWGKAAKLYYQFGEWCATKLGSRIVSDSRAIQAYYESRYHTPSTFIAYGAHVEGSTQPSILDEYGLEPGSYFFVASRLEPENHADLTVDAFEGVDTDKTLVIAGGANWDSPYVRGSRSEPAIASTCSARCTSQGTSASSTRTATRMCTATRWAVPTRRSSRRSGYGNCVLSLDVAFNAEVVGDAALLYKMDAADLRAQDAAARRRSGAGAVARRSG